MVPQRLVVFFATLNLITAMNSSGYWDRSSIGQNNSPDTSTVLPPNERSGQQAQDQNAPPPPADQSMNPTQVEPYLDITQPFLQHEVHLQPQYTPEEIRHSLVSNSLSDEQANRHHNFMQSIEEDDEYDEDRIDASFSRIGQQLGRSSSQHQHQQQHVRNAFEEEEVLEEDEEEGGEVAAAAAAAGGGGGGGGVEEQEQEQEQGQGGADEGEFDQDMIAHGASSSASRHQHQHHRHSEYEDVEGSESQQPSLEQVQRVYYTKGLQELENLQLVDLSALASWKLSTYKQGFGLAQLRDDNPETYWQSDGSNGGNNTNPNNSALVNDQLSNPHSVTIQFLKKVALERISIFTNYSLDESYTPSKIKIMAGSSEGWDLIDVCTVNFNQPIGWSHIIFNGIRSDGVLKCFMIKIFILANHQEGKDSHIRAIRCFGRKNSGLTKERIAHGAVQTLSSHGQGLGQGLGPGLGQGQGQGHSDLLKDLSIANSSSSFSAAPPGIPMLSPNLVQEMKATSSEEGQTGFSETKKHDEETARILRNVNSVLGNTNDFQSIELASVSTIR